MKKWLLGMAVAIALVALLAVPQYVHLPEDAAVTVTSFGESLVLSSEDSADVVERINRYGFWQRMDGNYCDCAGDYGMTIGEVRVVGGHLHWDERGLTLNLNDEDTREINWIAERYLERNR